MDKAKVTISIGAACAVLLFVFNFGKSQGSGGKDIDVLFSRVEAIEVDRDKRIDRDGDWKTSVNNKLTRIETVMRMVYPKQFQRIDDTNDGP